MIDEKCSILASKFFENCLQLRKLILSVNLTFETFSKYPIYFLYPVILLNVILLILAFVLWIFLSNDLCVIHRLYFHCRFSLKTAIFWYFGEALSIEYIK